MSPNHILDPPFAHGQLHVQSRVFLSHLTPSNELIPEHNSEDALQAEVRLDQAPGCCHYGELEWTS